MRLDLDPAIVTSVIANSSIKIKKGDVAAKAMNVKEMSADLLDAVARLVRWLDKPGDFKVLAPVIDGSAKTSISL